MSTKYFYQGMGDEVLDNWRPPRAQNTTIQLLVKPMVFALLVVLLAFVVGSLKDVSTTTSKEPSESASAESAASDAVKTNRQQAICVIRPIGSSGVSGTLHLVKRGDVIEIRGQIEGLTPGKHGFHIHEFGDLSDATTGKSAGGHFNPTNQPHGTQDASQRHVGDLGNIEAGKDGNAVVNIRDSVIQFSGPHSIIGRSLLIHAGADKFTQPAGDAGARVAFGVIGIAAGE